MTAEAVDYAAILDRTRKDPEWWVREVLGDRPWSKQVEILESVRDHRDTAAKSCHGAGKSWVAARVALWFLYAHCPSIVITTAPTDRQVRGILWKELRVAHSRSLLPLGGKLLTQELKLDADWWAWGFTAPDYDPDRFQGFHETAVLVIVDEACGVSDQIQEAILGILTSDQSRCLQIGNPTDQETGFGRSFADPSVSKVTIDAFESPNLSAFGITEADLESGAWEAKVTGPLPDPKLVTPQWCARVFKRYGKDSPYYQSRVLARFPQQGTDSLIPLHLIEQARNRSLEPSEPNELSADVARFGDDETVIGHRRGPVFRVHAVSSKEDTMQTTGRVARALNETGASIAKVDGIGVGAGVVDRLREQGLPVADMQAGQAARDNERFANARAEWWWGFRERCIAGDVDLPEEDEELAAQLSSIKYKIDSRGRVVIESKEDLKKRGRPSPDRGDSVVMAYASTQGAWGFDDLFREEIEREQAARSNGEAAHGAS